MDAGGERGVIFIAAAVAGVVVCIVGLSGGVGWRRWSFVVGHIHLSRWKIVE